jgi:hypothetical protein
MRFMSGVLVVVLLAPSGSVLEAQPRRIATFEETDATFPGSSTHLPVGGGVTPQQAIAHAYTMPAVQQALQLMQSRGYVPHPANDDAVALTSPPLTMVCLQFDKPGLVPPADHIAAPVLMIGTSVGPEGFPVTSVSGGVTFVNTTNARFFTADSLAEYSASDGSFDVTAGGGENDDGPRRRMPDTWGGTNSPGDAKLRSWIYCFSFGSLGIVTQIVTTTPPVPQLYVARIIVQHVIIAGSCLASAVF